MTPSLASGDAAGYRDPDNFEEVPVGAQQAALVRELRRLQKLVDQEQGRGRSARVVNLWPAEKTQSDHGPQAGTHASSKPSHTSCARHIASAPAKPERNRLRSAFRASRALLSPRNAFAALRSAYVFLVGRAHPAGSEGPETRLAARLMHAFEGELKAGLRVLMTGAGILGGWACLMPLSGAVIVPGTLVVESVVKKIQHPAGGVVADIPVRDGTQVRSGDLLLRLDETQARANAHVLTQQLNQIRVRLARLTAERDGLDQPQMPRDLVDRSDDQEVDRLWAAETSLFNSRAAARRTAKDLLHSHVGQLGEQIAGLEAQAKSKAAQHDLISGELEGVDSLYRKGLVPLARKTSLQREAARLDGEHGQVAAAIAEAKSKISEAELQAVRIDHDFRTEVMKDLREAQDKEAELAEKTIAAQD